MRVGVGARLLLQLLAEPRTASARVREMMAAASAARLGEDARRLFVETAKLLLGLARLVERLAD